MCTKRLASGNGEMPNAYVGNPNRPYPHGSMHVYLDKYIYMDFMAGTENAANDNLG